MDDGWGALLVIVLIATASLLLEYRDKRAGKYPRDWRD